MSRKFFVLLAIISTSLWHFSAVGAVQNVGEVIFLTGQVSLERDSKSAHLEIGTAIREQDRLATGQGSHVHLRMLDGAFISLRENSALRIDTYRFTPQSPDSSRARVTLIRGVARTVSGEIGARNKEHFRFNTPIAAIGIRGTDFSVMTTSRLSRMSVRSGGVTMAPLSQRCGSDALGSCEAGAAELYAQTAHALLETRLGDSMAILTYDGVAPDEYAPPHPRESTLMLPRVSDAGASGMPLSGKSAPGVGSYEEGLLQVERYLARPGLAADAFALGEAAGPEIQPRDRGLVDNPKVIWGRWSEVTSRASAQPSIGQLLYDDRQYAGQNSVFALLEDIPSDRRLPESGRAHFKLNSYDAFIKRGNDLEAAAISHPGLVVDFDTSRFATRLDVHAASLPGVVHVVGGGTLSASGLLRSDEQSPSHLDGVLTTGSGEAGLLFEYQIEPGVDAVGATHWLLNRE